MYKASEFVKPVYKAGETARVIGVTTETLRNYEDSGLIKFFRSSGGHRLIEREELLRFLDNKGLLLDDTKSAKRDVIYTRVSSHAQKVREDLDRQAVHVLECQDGLQNPLILKEVGSGLDDKREKLQELIKLVLDGKVNKVYVTHRDRLTRFGYHYLESVFFAKGVDIVVLNDTSQEKDVQQELMEDMMSLIASFSKKLAVSKDGASCLFTECMIPLVGKTNTLDETIAIIEGDDKSEEVKESL